MLRVTKKIRMDSAPVKPHNKNKNPTARTALMCLGSLRFHVANTKTPIPSSEPRKPNNMRPSTALNVKKVSQQSPNRRKRSLGASHIKQFPGTYGCKLSGHRRTGEYENDVRYPLYTTSSKRNHGKNVAIECTSQAIPDKLKPVHRDSKAAVRVQTAKRKGNACWPTALHPQNTAQAQCNKRTNVPADNTHPEGTRMGTVNTLGAKSGMAHGDCNYSV